MSPVSADNAAVIRPQGQRPPRAPGPRGSLLMGNLAEYKADPISMLLRLQQGWGDVACNRLGPFLTHALAHPHHAQYVLQENQANYVRGRFYDNFKLFFGDGLLTTDGEFWRRHRRAIQPMVHRPKLDSYVKPVGEAALGLIERWGRLGAGGQAIDVVPEMMHLSLRMLGRMVFNTDISEHAEAVGPSVRFALDAMMPQGNLNDFIPRWVPTPFHLRIWRARKAVDTIIDHIIQQHRTEAVEASDLISLLLAARHPETGEPMTDQEVHDEVMTVFLAGHETTGSGLAWALYALAQYPEVLRRLREELDAVLGGRAPAVEDFARLPYLDQVVHECLRVYPPIWGFTRDVVDDDVIGGFHIPARSSVFVSPYVTHRHPEFWQNPDAFDPENFAAGAPARHKFAFFPFGGGPRKCIGYQMAMMQMRVVVAVAAQHFDLNALPGHPIVRGALISLRPLEGIRLIPKPRAERVPARRPADPAPQAPASPASADSADAAEKRQAAAAAAGCPMARAAAQAPDAPPLQAGPALPAADRPKPVPKPAQRAESVSAMPRVAPPAARSVPTQRFVWQPAAAPALPATPSAALAGRRIAIVNGSAGSAERLAAVLARACAKAHVFTSDGPDVAADALRFRREHGEFDGIVDLTIAHAYDPADPDAEAWKAPLQRSVALLKAMHPDWLTADDPQRTFYVAATWLDGAMGHGGGAVHQPLGGLWAGLAKTLPQELPNCNVRVIDFDPQDDARAASRIASELYRWGAFEIGYRGDARTTLVARLAQPDTALPAPRPGEVVLVSGGARGIGLLFARAVAERHGATVVVTGRDLPPQGDEPWAPLDETAFRHWCMDQLRSAVPARTPVEVRRELDRIRRRRELGAVLADIEARGLPIRYRSCDVTDAQAVGRLVAEFAHQLRYVVHNAGIDQPLRLSRKSLDDFAGTVRTKVEGFAALAHATARLPLRQFINVGSLTGRWGGMTGETDYAAANDALARLGLWAAHAQGRVAKTMVWPTWDGVGMITNLDVTRHYVTPMAPQQGVAHWLAELRDGNASEAMFIGEVGRAVTPVQIRGFAPIPDLPNHAHLVTRLHYLGRPQRIVPFSSMETRHAIDRTAAPFLRQRTWPVAMLLEYAIASGDWVAPSGFRATALEALEAVRIDLGALALPPGDALVELTASARGSTVGRHWRVDVVMCEAAKGGELLRLTLVYRDGSQGDQAAPSPRRIAIESRLATPDDTMAPSSGSAGRALHDPLLRPATWVGRPDGSLQTQLEEATPASLWALADAPQLTLPVRAVEQLLRRLQPTAGIAEILHIDHVALAAPPAGGGAHAGTRSSTAVVAWPAEGRADIANAGGFVVAALRGISFEMRPQAQAGQSAPIPYPEQA